MQRCSALTPLGHSAFWTDPGIAAAPWTGGRLLRRCLLDARVVELPKVYPQTFVMLSSLKPLFFNSLKHEFRFSDHVGA